LKRPWPRQRRCAAGRRRNPTSYREQQLAVQYDRLRNREEALKRREQVVRDFISRIQKAKAEKIRAEGGK
jgi:hypothetical protein